MLPLAVTTSCCSVAGWAVGTAITRGDPPRRVPAGEALELKPGTKLGVLLADSTHQRGTYMGRIRLEPVVYRTRFDEWRAQVNFALEVGGMVELTHRDHRVTLAPFAGFAHRSVLLEKPGRPELLEVPLRDIRWFGMRDSLGWTGEQLADADLRGALPSREAILFKPDQHAEGEDWFNQPDRMWTGVRRLLVESVTIPRDDIEALEVAGPRTVRTVLLVAGLAADALIVVAAQPAVAVGGAGGCTYTAASARGRAFAGIEPTSREYDTRWGAYVGEGAPPVLAAEGAAADAQLLGVSDLPSFFMSPPAAMPRNAHR